MRKSAAAVLFLSFFLLGAPRTANSDEKPEIKVGALVSLSGGLEQWCGYIRQGIELAAAEEGPVRVTVIFEDDRSFDKKAVVTAAQKLIQIDKVDLLYSWTASTVPVLAPPAAAARTPLLAGAYDRNVAAGGPYVFGAFVNYDLVPREIARFLIRKGARRLGLLLAADDWSQNFEKAFREEASRRGVSIIFAETASPEEKDMQPFVLKLKKDRVDGVMAPLFANSLYAFLKQARAMHYTGMIHVGDGMFEEDLKIAGADAEGVYAAQIWLDSPELVSSLRTRFGTEANPLQLGLIASGYDWVKHLRGAGAEIVRQGKPISRQTLRDVLTSFSSRGFLGEQMYGQPPAGSGEITVVVKDGRYVPAE